MRGNESTSPRESLPLKSVRCLAWTCAWMTRSTIQKKISSSCETFVRCATSPCSSAHQPETNIVPQAKWPQCSGAECQLCSKWMEEGKGAALRKSMVGREVDHPLRQVRSAKLIRVRTSKTMKALLLPVNQMLLDLQARRRKSLSGQSKSCLPLL